MAMIAHIRLCVTHPRIGGKVGCGTCADSYYGSWLRTRNTNNPIIGGSSDALNAPMATTSYPG